MGWIDEHINTVIQGDCLEVMKQIPDNSIDLVVTSPPYDNLRDYQGYSFNFEGIAKELFRAIKQGGVVVWVVGDSMINGSESGTSFSQALFFKEIGLRLHDTMIYKKQSPAYPASEKSTRYGQVFEYMFILSKGVPKTVNLLRDKKNRWAGEKSFGTPSRRLKNGELERGVSYKVPEYSYRYNIWKYHAGSGYGQSDDISREHPATFPELLAHDHIMSWSNENDIVLDPFSGSGTTCKMALKSNRRFIGIEISEKYCEIARKRIEKERSQIKMEF